MRVFTSLTLVLFMACPHTGSAQASLKEQDVQFLKQVAQSGMLETQASQLALQGAAEEDVKQYAQVMLTEHKKIDDDLQALARAHDLKLPTELEGKFRDTLADLQRERGAEFDRRYIYDVAIGAHEDAIELSKRIARETQMQDINTFAEKSVKVMQQHLDRAKNIAKNRKTDKATPSNTLPSGQPKPQGTQPTMEGEPGTPEKAAGTQ